MSFANFGIGMNALAQGLNTGIDAGTKINNLIDQGQLRQARQQGMQDAKAAQSSAIDNLVKTGSAASADDTMTVPTYSVGDKQFADQGTARQAATKKAGSLDEYYQKVAAPKIYEKYLEIDPQKAAAWKDWNDSEQVKTGQKHWAQAIAKANMGDFEGFGDSIVKAYNTRGYMDDGTMVKDWKTIKDKDGNATGAELTFQGPDGKEFKQSVNGMEEAYRVGSQLLSPEQVFATGWQEIQQGRKAQLEAQKDGRNFQQQVALSDRQAQQRGALQQQSDVNQTNRMLKGKEFDQQNENSALTKKMAVLKQAGYGDQFIKEALPQMLGIGQYKKPADPKETARMLFQSKMQSDFAFARKTPQEQAADIQQTIKMLDDASGSDDTPAQQQPSPMSGGIAPQGGGLMIYDRKTGKMVPYGQ